MAKRGTTPEVEEEVEAVEVEVVETVSDKDSVSVTWRGNVRVFSKELHGADFKKLAKDFAEKFNGVVA